MQIRPQTTTTGLQAKGAAYYTPWLIAITCICIFYLRRLFAPGMQLDGTVYASISQNLAQGIGTFWSPFFTKTCWPQFYEHPPLVFGIQSLFFMLFGNHLFVEKLYTCISFVLSAWLIVKIWNAATGTRGNAWLALILWVSVPEVAMGYANNFLENTMGVFCFGGCYLLLRGFTEQKNILRLSVISGFLVLLGFLCKGPFALFPLALPGFYWISSGKITFRQAFVSTIGMLALLIIGISALLLWPPARYNLLTYFHNQVIMSISGERETFNGHFFLLNSLTYQLHTIYIITRAVLPLGIIFLHRKGVRPLLRPAIFFLLMALSINLPVLISPKQLEQYIICAYAFYALAAAALIFPYISYCIQWLAKVLPLFFRIANILCIAAIPAEIYYAYNTSDQYAISEDVITGLEKLGPYMPHDSTIVICRELGTDWSLQAILYRRYHISMTQEANHQYELVVPSRLPAMGPEYKIVAQDEKYILMRRM